MKKTIQTLYTGFKKPSLLKHILQFTGNQLGGNLSIGKNVNIRKSEIIGDIVLKKNTYIDRSLLLGKIMVGDSCKIYQAYLYAEQSLNIGDYTSLWGPGISILQKIHPVTIGKFCSIARGVSIQEYNHNSKKITSYYIGKNVFKENWVNENVSKGSIEIGNDVWIGANALIISGAKIGNGCIVAGNAVANDKYPDYAIIAGVPGKVIGYRFEPETIEYLKELRWWDWDIDKIKENKDLFINEF